MESSLDRTTLPFAPIHALIPEIARGTLTVPELTQACLDQISRYDPALHAFVEVYRKDVLAAAEASEKALRAGFRLGPLHGIPIALKDLCELEGRRTSGGSAAWRERVSDHTCTVARKLMGAGMLPIGKTHMVEFAFGGWGTNEHMGTPHNPWDAQVHRVPGGSSSGSGVAVAAGMAPAALGSDTGGSVRIPSSMCGLVGLKTTAGRVSNHGILPLSRTLDTIGPMTRSVEDAALLFDVLHGPDPADPATLVFPPVGAWPELRGDVKGLRLGILGASHLERVDGEVMGAFVEAIETLRSLGITVEEMDVPRSFFSYPKQTQIIISSEAYEALGEVAESSPGQLDPNVAARVLSGKNITAPEYQATLREMAQARSQTARLFERFHAFLTPTTPIPAIPLAEVDEAVLPLSRFTRAVNYLGLCGLALPSGISAEGLPLSLQIVGQPLDEARILRIGWAFEQARQTPIGNPDLSGFTTGAHAIDPR